MKYIIEHLEPRLYKWCIIEYEHISDIVGKNNLVFTNIREKDRHKLKGLGKVYSKSIAQIITGKHCRAGGEFDEKRLCLMDANASKTLLPPDAERFNFLVFGGILGDEPPQRRTEKELGHLGLPSRNLGRKQMPTDTAVYVAKKILSGTAFENIKFKDGIEISISEGESVQFPFRYAVENGKPVVSQKLVEYLKKRKGF